MPSNCDRYGLAASIEMRTSAYPRRDTQRYAQVRIPLTLLNHQDTARDTHHTHQCVSCKLVRIHAVKHDFKGKYLSFRIKAYRVGAYPFTDRKIALDNGRLGAHDSSVG